MVGPKHPLFPALWERWAPEIDKAVWHECHDISDVRRFIEEGYAQFWPDTEAAMVTEIVTYPRGKALRIWLASGTYEGVRRCEARAIAWAKEQGCTQSELTGRMGWRRRLTDYRERAVCMVKEI